VEDLVRIRGLWKSYGETLAVADLSLSIRVGEIHGLLGPNGAGKTTVVKCIVGLLKPDKGQIVVNGVEITSSESYKSLIGYLPEDPALPEYLTVEEFLGYLARLRSVKPQEAKLRIDELMEIFNLARFKREFIGSLSKGLRQRVAVASAFIHKPKILILDEPFLGLDPEGQLKVKSMVKEIVKDGGAALISTHMLDMAERFCDTVTIMYMGREIISGDVESIKQVVNANSLEEAFIKLVNRR